MRSITVTREQLYERAGGEEILVLPHEREERAGNRGRDFGQTTASVSCRREAIAAERT